MASDLHSWAFCNIVMKCQKQYTAYLCYFVDKDFNSRLPDFKIHVFPTVPALPNYVIRRIFFPEKSDDMPSAVVYPVSGQGSDT